MFTTTVVRHVATSIDHRGKFSLYASSLGIGQKYAQQQTLLSAQIAPSQSKRTDTPVSPGARYARSAPYTGKGVQGTPQETENTRPRTKEQTAAGAQGADGRSRARKRWFSRDGKLTIQVPIQHQNHGHSRDQRPGPARLQKNKKKQQKKPVTRKKNDGTVSRKAPFFSASPTAPNNTNTQTVLVGKNRSAPPKDEVEELRQTIQTLRAENAEPRQKLNDLIDELKALRTGQTNANPRSDLTLTATVGRQEFTTTMAAIKNALANLSNLISNIQDEARKDRERLVQLTAMKFRG
ncbi:hypothetical protein HPB51_013527 [Rhipicephalus microplus]|uniref:Uncharacterized protein n=1 Tax=Rhipicephalus microplus TaxID=6941 RepID=A0A9J6EA88_RHIMP|nr:hypothetical protein HPB51_013527 [Rhipicephalus microplus]